MTEKYAFAAAQARALVEGTPEDVPNMANLAALVWQTMDRINWAGFYTVTPQGDLLLGPFQGKPACIRIPYGKGVCGTALARQEALVVPDVHAFPGHIACDSASRSETVAPVVRDGKVIAVLDVDSPEPDRFGPEDVEFLQAVAEILAQHP